MPYILEILVLTSQRFLFKRLKMYYLHLHVFETHCGQGNQIQY